MSVTTRFAHEKISADYAKFRPTYPKQVLEALTSYMKKEGHENFNTALDVSCGSGQSTFLLCEGFQNVIGVDVSHTQIEQAELKKKQLNVTNVDFIVGDAHNLLLEDSSVDLLTCAMAWHWLDADRFYSEAKRVLKPGGCLAIYGYEGRVWNNQRIGNAYDTFFNELLKCKCFTEHNLPYFNKFRDVQLPFSHTERVEFPYSQRANFDQILGFFSSISVCDKHSMSDLLKHIRCDYENSLQRCNTENYSQTIFILLGST